jgi:hypothetical protein
MVPGDLGGDAQPNRESLGEEFCTVATTGKTIDQLGISITGSGTQAWPPGGQW